LRKRFEPAQETCGPATSGSYATLPHEVEVDIRRNNPDRDETILVKRRKRPEKIADQATLC